jgi:hypothetical protein
MVLDMDEQFPLVNVPEMDLHIDATHDQTSSDKNRWAGQMRIPSRSVESGSLPALLQAA